MNQRMGLASGRSVLPATKLLTQHNMLHVLKRILPSADSNETVVECRQCGANLDEGGVNQCPECGACEVARYHL